MESQSNKLLKTDATCPQTPENRVANNGLNQATTPIGRTIPSHGNYPSSTDVVMRLPPGQQILPSINMPSARDGTLLMAHPQDRLLSEIEDLKAQNQPDDQRVSQNQSKLFWGFIILRNIMLALAFASIVFVVFVATTIVLIAYAAPLLLELTEMVDNKTSGTEVMT
ncbi:hypothetical protein FMEXI_5071 [Fusarium mexicanum]|uniref:Uncharacterized protein n=1 Tax=Fusarium mexicanum TaxID=751941 RepID=A0A8H5J597_9HYPO|nr:hypothetical protein FMEXI_5071 [Fusarium mexicanum]